MLNFHSSATNKKSDAMVREIAERTSTEILSQLGATLAAMSEPELRGYVRARAWPIVCDGLHQLTTSDRTSVSRREELAGRILEQTVHIVTRACTIAPVVSTPMPHIGRRAA